MHYAVPVISVEHDKLRRVCRVRHQVVHARNNRFLLPPAATCPKCQYMQAYFMEIQTRSADEPATLFFKCVQCGHRWREG